MKINENLIYSVKERMEFLEVGQHIPVEGSLAYWRNVQNRFHNDYPQRQVKIFVYGSTYVCVRKK